MQAKYSPILSKEQGSKEIKYFSNRIAWLSLTLLNNKFNLYETAWEHLIPIMWKKFFLEM